MKLSRAVLLSSMMQAESGEYQDYPVFFSLIGRGQKLIYRYLVTDCRAGGENLVFEIFRVSQESYVDEREQERTRNKVAEEPHVHEVFENMEKLIEFLDRYQIDVEDGWQPVEPA